METDPLAPRPERINVNPSHEGSGKLWIWVIVAVLIVVIGGAAYFFLGRSSDETADETELTSDSPTSAPEPTEEDIDLAAYEIEVLNGTETAGEAGKLKTALEEAGFTVPSAGNADKDDYTKVIIQAKSDVSSGFIKKLTEELEKTYTVGEEEELADDDEHDVVIIIGMESTGNDDEDEEASDEAETEDADPTDTPTPSPTP